MKLKELVLKNRSYRGYNEAREITRDELTELIELARFTPSSVNAQPLRYALVYEKDRVEAVLGMTRWAARLKKLKLPMDGKHPSAFIIICQDMSVTKNVEQFRYDVGIAAQTMLLGAAEMGLGGCMLGNFDEDAIRELLGLDDELMVHLVVALGEPDEEVILTGPLEDGSVGYYRDETGLKHYVPKRTVEELVVKG